MSVKTMKILTTIATILLIISMGTTIVYGTEFTPKNLTSIETNAVDSVKDLGGKIMGVIQVAGVVVAVIIIMILGIKYMMGSAEEKADYKKTMIPYLVGAILIFAGSTIANVVYEFANGLNA